jgi:hypothetical protein
MTDLYPNETIVSLVKINVDEATADLAEIKTYEKEAKERLAEAKAEAKRVEGAVKFYAPRVVDGIKFLNKNARGWAKTLATTEGVLDITLSEEDAIKFGLVPTDKNFPDIADEVLAALWETSLKIHKQKKPVTLPRLLKKVGV